MQRLDAKAESLEELSPRQRQILQLLRAGKVNKEIASELQIGVGTVKQHVVALFKRLQVSNRAMAVARSGEFEHSSPSAQSTMQADGLLQRRPCVILCVGLGEDAPASAVRQLHASLAALAFDHDALFLARKGNAGDLIFGIGRVSERDALKAIQVLQHLQNTFSQQLASDQEQEQEQAQNDQTLPDHDLPPKTLPPNGLRAALIAGLVVASMNRYGGWSGEAVASASITSGRNLLDQAQAGQLLLSPQVQQLMLAFGIAEAEDLQPILSLQHLENFHWRGERPGSILLGREQEWAQLNFGLQEIPQRSATACCNVVYLCGETGMGKSLLCRQLAGQCLQQNLACSFWRCMPSPQGFVMQDVVNSNLLSVAQWLALEPAVGLVILDDLHLLPLELQTQCIARARLNSQYVVIATRRIYHRLAHGEELIQLHRMSQEEIEVLIRAKWQSQPATQGRKNKSNPQHNAAAKQLAKMAAGVPMFAIELASNYSPEQVNLPRESDVGLVLAVIVSARLDELALDRCLLQQLANFSQPCTLAQLEQEMLALAGEGGSAQSAQSAATNAQLWRKNLDAALAAGVVRETGKGETMVLQFAHPMMRLVLAWLAKHTFE